MKNIAIIAALALLPVAAHANYIDAAHHHTHRVDKAMAIADPSSPSAVMHNNYDMLAARNFNADSFSPNTSANNRPLLAMAETGNDVLTVSNAAVSRLKMNSAFNQTTYNAPAPTDAPVAAPAFAVQTTTLAPIMLTPPPSAVTAVSFDTVMVPAKASMDTPTPTVYAANTAANVNPNPANMLPRP